MTKNRIANYLQQDNKSIGNLLSRFQLLTRWNEWLAACLPQQEALMSHCKIVALDNASLIVIADNPHWVTRFRFFIPELLVKLREYPDFKNIRAICCKVNPPRFTGSTYHKRRRPLIISEQNAMVLQEAAKKIQNTKLRAVLERLAGRVMKEDDE